MKVKGLVKNFKLGTFLQVNFSFPHCFIAMRVKLLQTEDFRNSCRVLNKEMHTQIEVWPVPGFENWDNETSPFVLQKTKSFFQTGRVSALCYSILMIHDQICGKNVCTFRVRSLLWYIVLSLLTQVSICLIHRTV